MTTPSLCTWRHVEPAVIPYGVRWYRRHSRSYRNVEELPWERGLSMHHTTVFRAVQCYAPKNNNRFRPHLQLTNHASRVDETYRKICKVWHDLEEG
jgi:IS6 family transposase